MKIVSYSYEPNFPAFRRFRVIAEDSPEMVRVLSVVGTLGLDYNVDYTVWDDTILFSKDEHRTMFLLKL